MTNHTIPNPKGLNAYYLRGFCVSTLLLSFALAVHFFAPGPNGDALELRPWDYFPGAVLTHALLLAAAAALFACLDRLFRNRSLTVKLAYAAFAVLYLELEFINLEISRWLGPLSLGYMKTFVGSGTGKYTSPEGMHFMKRLILEDLPVILAIGAPAILAVAAGAALFLRRRRYGTIKAFTLAVIGAPAMAACLAACFLYPKPVWTRIRPILLTFTAEAWEDLTQRSYPRNPKLAFADLMSYSRGGGLADEALESIPEYPLLKSGPGTKDAEAFAALPREKRPNVIFLEMESLRGWESGLDGDAADESQTPEMDAFLKKNAAYFPWTHSNGFLSAVGTLCMNLSLLPHYSRFVATDYKDLNAASLPGILREFGYATEMQMGTDPAISNFTTWFERWYDRTLLDEAVQEDHRMFQAMDGVIARLSSGDKPFYLAMYSISSHIPFTVPESEGVEPGKTMEKRFDQVIRYSTKHMVEFLERLKASDLWDDTVVVICGDHSYPTPDQIRLQRSGGGINAGHTWVSMAFTGGWPGLPAPGRYDRVATQIDLPVTLLKLLDIDAANSFMGQDLFSQPERPGLAVRERDVMLQYPDKRYFFNLLDDDVKSVPSRRSKTDEYAMLGNYRFVAETKDDIEAERWRDMLRAISWLYEKDRIFPPEAALREAKPGMVR